MTFRPTTLVISSRLRGGAKVLLPALAVAGLTAAPALAAAPSPSPATFGLTAEGSSGSILVHGAAGHVVRGVVLLRNFSRHRMTVVVQPAVIATATNGNADYVTAPLSGAGRWLHLSAHKVRLGPKGSRQVNYAVRVPAGTTGASHYAGIVAFNAADLSHAGGHGKSQGSGFTFYRVNREALPLTVRLPGRLTRSLSLRSVKLSVAPGGAGLVLGLRPGGTELIEGAQVRLRVMRGGNRVFASSTALGQLFPGSALNYRIPWKGTPKSGTYRVIGTIRPQGSKVIRIDQTVGFTPATAAALKHVTPPPAGAAGAVSKSSLPSWVWIAAGAAAALMVVMSITVYRLARRTHSPA